MTISRQALLADLPPEWPEDLMPRIRTAVHASGVKLVVLDDDPTGNQTVHDVAVLTTWSINALTEALRERNPVVYILTNTRSLPLPSARALNREVAVNLKAAQNATSRPFAIISRSDSTLRGHYPGETQALAQALGSPFDATLIVPFFPEGGRITAGDVHYVAEGDLLTPAAETEYARDMTFGYHHSNLRAWVADKHGDAFPPEAVASLPLDVIRRRGPDAVTQRLGTLAHGGICFVNAVSYRDIEVVVAGLLEAEAQGKRFLARTAASFVRVRGGILPRPLLTRSDLALPTGSGLIVVGSHVPKTTRQIAAAKLLPRVVTIEVSVRALLDPAGRGDEISRAIDRSETALQRGEDVLVVTSREVVAQTPSLSSLQVGHKVSAALVGLVRRLSVRPAWIIAKGGITSSDVATHGLDVARAAVLGQAIPGVPIWRLGPESRWPGMVYVVFPGNVGDDDALAAMITLLRGPS